MVRRHILQPSRCIYSTDVAVSSANSDNVDRVSVYLTTPAPGNSAGATVSGKCDELVSEEDPARLIPSRLRSLLARHELDLRHQVGGTSIRSLIFNVTIAEQYS